MRSALSPLLRLLRQRLSPLALLALLQGCQAPRAEVLHIYLVPGENNLLTASRDYSRELVGPVLKAFQRLHPHVQMHVQLRNEEQMEAHLLQRQRRGLGPDLLLVRSSFAIALARQGLIDPLPSTPDTRASEASIIPSVLERVRDRGLVTALPVANEVTLACYDRRRISDPPQTLDQLLAQAASGNTVGLSVDPIGLWWTTGGFAATDALAPVITGIAAPIASSRQESIQRVERWLQWLRQAALQSRVDIGTGHDELLEGLVSGRLAWVPCYSLTLMGLEKRMGERLGVSALPAGPIGAATPFTSVRAWAFGTDSSPRQRRLAEDLARLSINPLLQRQISLTSKSMLPVNRFVSIPYADSGLLAAMGEAQGQFLANAKLVGLPFSSDRVRVVLPRMEDLLYQVITGLISPRQGAEALLDLENQQ